LGNSNIISEIITELENKENLGFIYPETFYKVLLTYGKNKIDLYSNQINLLLNKIFPNNKIIKNKYFEYINWYYILSFFFLKIYSFQHLLLFIFYYY